MELDVGELRDPVDGQEHDPASPEGSFDRNQSRARRWVGRARGVSFGDVAGRASSFPSIASALCDASDGIISCSFEPFLAPWPPIATRVSEAEATPSSTRGLAGKSNLLARSSKDEPAGHGKGWALTRVQDTRNWRRHK
jgi:hypothetical protein